MRKAHLGGGRNSHLDFLFPPPPAPSQWHVDSEAKGTVTKTTAPQALLDPADTNLNSAKCEF